MANPDPPRVTIAVSPDGRYAAVGTAKIAEDEYGFDRRNGSLSCWSRDRTAPRWTLHNLPPILSAAWSPDAGTLAVGTANGQLKLLDPGGGRQRTMLTLPPSESGPPPGVDWLSYSSDSRTLVALLVNWGSCADSATLAAWDTRTRRRLFSKDLSTSENQLSMARSGVWVRDFDTLSLLDVRTGRTLRTSSASEDADTDLGELSPDNRWFAASEYEQSLRLYLLIGHKGSFIVRLDSEPLALRFSHNSRRLFIATARGQIVEAALSREGLRRAGVSNEVRHGLHAAAFTPDGRYVVCEWDTGAKVQFRPLRLKEP